MERPGCRPVLLLLLVVAWLPLPAGAALSLDGYDPGAREDLVLELSLDGHRLDDGMHAIRADGEVVFPLRHIAERLELGLTVDAGDGRVGGWLGAEEEPIRLDPASGEGQRGGEPLQVDPGRLQPEGGDLYMPVEALERLLPVAASFDERNQALRLEAEGPLPLLERLERVSRWNDLRERPREVATRPLQHDPYRPWTPPAWALALEHRYYSHEHLQSRTDGELRMAGDLGWHEARLFASTTDDELRRLDVTLARDYRSPWLTRYEVGQVTAPGAAMLTRNRSGLGVSATNAPRGRPAMGAGDYTVEGEAPDGWSAELYHNGHLVAFDDAIEGGRYRFDQAPVTPGENRYDVRLYGPRGEVRTARETIFSGPGMLPPGEVHYDVSHFRTDRSLVGDYRTPLTRTDESRSRVRATMGVTRRLSTGVEWHRSESAVGHPERSMAMDLTGSIGLAWWRLRHARDLEDGSANSVELQRPLGRWLARVGHTRVDGLESEDLGTGLDARSELMLSGPVTDWLRWRSDYRHERLEDDSRHRLRLFQSGGMHGVRVAHRYERNWGERLGRYAHGSLDVSTHRLRDRYSVGLRYSAEPEAEADYLRATWNRQVTRPLATRLELRTAFSERFDNALTAGVSARMQRVRWGVSGTWEEGGEWRLTAALEFGAQPNPHTGGWRFSGDSRRHLHDGAVAVRVLHQREDGLVPMEGVPVRGGGVRAWTGADGVALLRGVEPWRRHDIRVDMEAIEDPFVRQISDEVSVQARPGAVQAVEYQLATTAEVEGTVLRRTGEGVQPMAGVRVIALDSDGERVAETATAFDGLYILDRLLPGRYTVRLHPDAAARLEVDPDATAISVEIDWGGDIVRNVDFEL